MHIDAPWRSLIYRNVDTPFTYADDFAIFPHMPMHSPGFDCRAPRIMGDWMVSIPAVRKNAEAGEDTVPGGRVPVDSEPQPYVEVKPGEPGYERGEDGRRDTAARLPQGGRYGRLCPDTTRHRRPHRQGQPGRSAGARAEPLWGGEDKQTMLLPGTRVPVRPHWVVTI